MKSKDLARQYSLDPAGFDKWIKESRRPHKSGMTGVTLPDDTNIETLVGDYQRFVAQEESALAARREVAHQAAAAKAEAEQTKQQALARMLITSGFNFDGYTITRYSGYISGDHAVSMDRPSHGWLGGVHGDVGADLLAGLQHIRRNALIELKEAAYALGCNAVIGVDFDYLTLDPETATNQGGTLYLPFLFAVTANGNAVVIEKNA